MASAAELLAALVLDGPRKCKPRQRNPGQPCVYCGRPAYRRACHIHADLLRLDPHYRR